MNDNTSLNKIKPAVFYTKKSKDDKISRSQDKRGKENTKNASQHNKLKSSNSKYKTNDKYDRDIKNESRIKTFKSNNKTSITSFDSPWNRTGEKKQSFGSDKNKLTVDQQQLKHQRKKETLVYGENSCKAVFTKRPEAIVKALFLKDKTHDFKSLIAWLVEHRLGYDVIDEEKMAKIAQTPHHGGVCLIVKKRQSLSVNEYLQQRISFNQDCILAIDDINNPHNLGGIARTAAFFNVNGLLLRHTDVLNNGAAHRVAEGGVEFITPIKADDFIVSLDQFKKQGYQIIALLPCKVNTLKAERLDNISINARTVIVIFQQINLKLAEFADKIVYLPGSQAMPALNISVLTGILLANIASQ